MVGPGSTQIKFTDPLLFRRANSIPKKPWHSGKLIESRIGTTVLVIQGSSELDGYDCGDRNLVVVGDPDLQRRTVRFDQVLEPHVRARRQRSASAHRYKKAVEVIEQVR